GLVVADGVDRFARIVGFELRDLLAVLLERVGELQQGLRTLPRSGPTPFGERPARGLDRTVDVLGGGHGRFGDRLASGGVQDRLGPTLGRIDELATDEVLKRRGRRHSPGQTYPRKWCP